MEMLFFFRQAPVQTGKKWCYKINQGRYDKMIETLMNAKNVLYWIVYLQLKWPLFIIFNPSKQGLLQAKQGSFGFPGIIIMNDQFLNSTQKKKQKMPGRDTQKTPEVVFGRIRGSSPVSSIPPIHFGAYSPPHRAWTCQSNEHIVKPISLYDSA